MTNRIYPVVSINPCVPIAKETLVGFCSILTGIAIGFNAIDSLLPPIARCAEKLCE